MTRGGAALVAAALRLACCGLRAVFAAAPRLDGLGLRPVPEDRDVDVRAAVGKERLGRLGQAARVQISALDFEEKRVVTAALLYVRNEI